MVSRYLWLIFLINFVFSSCSTSVKEYHSFNEYPAYLADDLGLSYTPNRSVFRIWAPTATEALIHFYQNALNGKPLRTEAMQRGPQGSWSAISNEDLIGKYYTFQVLIDGKWLDEVPDPYAKAVGTNGRRAMVVDLRSTDPPGFRQHPKPPLHSPNDIILYELHIRDLSSHPNSGIRQSGKFLGLAESGTRSPDGLSTGLDHIKELGVTHVHLLPSYDFYTVDESRPDEPQFNWGYDPQNYNVPEGSYATDPEDGAVRIREFKKMVKALHDKGLRVVMDVVYNHTGVTEASNFNQLVPGYYYRQNAEGGFSDASACGNETASERAMVRKFMVESVLYWVKEYRIDGFRFDLMGIHDIETMNLIADTLHSIDPSVFIYGEGWTAGESPLPELDRALKKHTHRLRRIAAFSDDIRDGIKGNVFDKTDRGFASGKPGTKQSVQFGIAAATAHQQVDYSKVNYSPTPWAKTPAQCINYVSCHDNHTLYDRLINSAPDVSQASRLRMHKLANAIVLTSQGVPFLHAGVEMLRSKGGEENSYKSPDSVNQLDWSRKATYANVFQYYKDLIRLRKEHPAFRMPTNDMIREHLHFLNFEEENLIGYTLGEHANGDSWKRILVLLNGSLQEQAVSLPTGRWTLILDGEKYRPEGIREIKQKMIRMPASTAWVLFSN